MGYRLSPAMSLGCHFDGYAVTHGATGAAPMREHRRIAHAKTAEQAKAIAQRHYERWGAA
jgi:hypothetical protein